MLNPVYCRGCGQRLEIPEGFAKAKLRCGDCGVYTDLPAELREQLAAAPRKEKPAAAAAPSAARPAESDSDVEDGYTFLVEPAGEAPPAPPSQNVPVAELVPDEPLERELLVQGTEEDDLNPYTVHGDAPTRPCPECGRRTNAKSKACIHCGFNFSTKAKAKRVYEPVRREWENGWPLQTRLSIFMGLQFLNFIMLVVSLISGYSPCAALFAIGVTIGAQAFLAGTFEKLILSRESKGKVKVTRIWRYCFFPRPPINVRWKEHESLSVVQSNDFSPVDWAFAIVLLGYGIVPGVLFWWFVIRPDKFTVYLCKDHGYPETPIFRTTNESMAKEILSVVSEVTTLPVQ
jgi:ribosomal protein L37E